MKFAYVLISGMGPMATLHSLYTFPYTISKIWNLGIAGALNKELIKEEVYEVKEVGKLSPTSHETSDHGIHVFNQLYPKLHCTTDCTASYRLITTDYPLYHDLVKSSLRHSWDLVDMEAYAFASFAKKHKLPLRIWKGVSDGASPSGEFSIVDTLPKTSKKLAEKIAFIL